MKKPKAAAINARISEALRKKAEREAKRAEMSLTEWIIYSIEQAIEAAEKTRAEQSTQTATA